MSLHALESRLRDRAELLDGNGAQTVELAPIYRAIADELAAALAGGGEAVAWGMWHMHDSPSGPDYKSWAFYYSEDDAKDAAHRSNNYLQQAGVSTPQYFVEPLFTHPAGAVQVTDAQCEAVYQAVTMSNLTRDVKSPERKQAIVRNALNPGGSRE